MKFRSLYAAALVACTSFSSVGIANASAVDRSAAHESTQQETSSIQSVVISKLLADGSDGRVIVDDGPMILCNSDFPTFCEEVGAHHWGKTITARFSYSKNGDPILRVGVPENVNPLEAQQMRHQFTGDLMRAIISVSAQKSGKSKAEAHELMNAWTDADTDAIAIPTNIAKDEDMEPIEVVGRFPIGGTVGTIFGVGAGLLESARQQRERERQELERQERDRARREQCQAAKFPRLDECVQRYNTRQLECGVLHQGNREQAARNTCVANAALDLASCQSRIQAEPCN